MTHSVSETIASTGANTDLSAAQVSLLQFEKHLVKAAEHLAATKERAGEIMADSPMADSALTLSVAAEQKLLELAKLATDAHVELQQLAVDQGLRLLPQAEGIPKTPPFGGVLKALGLQ